MMMTSVLLAVALMTPQEALLKAALPDVFAKSAAHCKAIDAAATPLMDAGEGCLRQFPHGFNRKTRALDMRPVDWWASGHFAGSLRYLCEATLLRFKDVP